jgi:hypothetical protein
LAFVEQLACLLGFAGLGIYGMDKWEQDFLPSELYSSNSPGTLCCISCTLMHCLTQRFMGHAEFEYFKLDEKLFPDGSNPIQIITAHSNFSAPSIGTATFRSARAKARE